jgi:tRNA dimethylallyltransferase
MSHTLVVIAGPTAVGKTALSITIANVLKTEIISADSRQFYKEISIGTAKPSKKELSSCTHHFINNKSIKENYTAAQFEQESLALLETLFKNHNQIIMTGGTGLYIDAVCNGFDNAPPSDPFVRAEFQELLKTNGLKYLQDLLIKVDANYAKIVDLNNPQRVLRALEINKLSGKNMAHFLSGVAKKRPFNILKICLTMDRDLLYYLINQRVDKMIKLGLEDEALAYYHLRNMNALNTVGYKEFFDYFEGKMGYDETVDKIKQNSRNYAKRQLTWFRRDKSYLWFDVNKDKDLIIPQVLKLIN